MSEGIRKLTLFPNDTKSECCKLYFQINTDFIKIRKELQGNQFYEVTYDRQTGLYHEIGIFTHGNTKYKLNQKNENIKHNNEIRLWFLNQIREITLGKYSFEKGQKYVTNTVEYEGLKKDLEKILENLRANKDGFN